MKLSLSKIQSINRQLINLNAQNEELRKILAYHNTAFESLTAVVNKLTSNQDNLNRRLKDVEALTSGQVTLKAARGLPYAGDEEEEFRNQSLGDEEEVERVT